MSESRLIALSPLAVSESLIDDLTSLMSIAPEVLTALAPLVNTGTGFGVDAENADELARIWSETGKAPDVLSSIFSMTKYLYDLVIEKEVTSEEVLRHVGLLCEHRDIDGFEERREALGAIITPRSDFLDRDRYGAYLRGVLPSLSSVSGSVEMRAVYPSTSSDESVGFVPVVQIRLVSRYDLDDDKVDREVCVFQASESALSQLIMKLETIRAQVESARGDLENAGLNVYDFES